MMIRAMQLQDLDTAARLASQLGYPSTPGQVRLRFERIIKMADHRILVAERNQTILGWIHLARLTTLCTDPRIEVVGLVVDESQRGQGIGARLLKKAETYARETDVKTVRLGSNIKRLEAHRFYEREGFTLTKQSLIFLKEMN
ncbi:MAG: GNAT family N-acetyltransferase [Bdellovibrionota bacterium]